MRSASFAVKSDGIAFDLDFPVDDYRVGKKAFRFLELHVAIAVIQALDRGITSRRHMAFLSWNFHTTPLREE
ncbi:MAG: hypothetical protein ABI273_04095 [Lacunisphaera sp.]